jgi:hypothetical protein
MSDFAPMQRERPRALCWRASFAQTQRLGRRSHPNVRRRGMRDEMVYAENNWDDFNQGLAPIPQADKPDF